MAVVPAVNRQRVGFERPRAAPHILSVRSPAGPCLRTMGIEAVSPQRRTTKPHRGHKIDPSWLWNLELVRPDPVWATDITSVSLRHGFLYRVAVLDWFRRSVLNGRLSITLEGSFCCEALEEALRRYFEFYCEPRVRQSLAYRTPSSVSGRSAAKRSQELKRSRSRRRTSYGSRAHQIAGAWSVRPLQSWGPARDKTLTGSRGPAMRTTHAPLPPSNDWGPHQTPTASLRSCCRPIGSSTDQSMSISPN